MARRSPQPRTAVSFRVETLREDYQRGGFEPLKVDREKCVIYRCKILGWESANGRRYVPEGVRKSVHLYEGCKVYCDHDQSGAARKSDDALGVFRNVTWEPGGVYADLHYLSAHPMAQRVVEDAERGLGIYGFSHDASGDGSRDADGTEIITAITEVRSVDLVTNPATVSNLREGRMIKTTLRKLVEGSKLPAKAKKALLREMNGDDEVKEMADEPMDAPAGDADGRKMLGSAVAALVQSSDTADHELAQKIMKLLKPEAPATEQDGDDKKDADPKQEKKEGDDDKPDDKKESRRPSTDPAKILREEIEIRDLIEDADLRFDSGKARKVFVKSLIPLSESERQELIDERKKAQAASPTGPMSEGPRPVKESKGDAPKLDFGAKPEEQQSNMLRFLRTGSRN